MYVTIIMPILINSRWFLPFQQVKYLGETMIPMVPHKTRGGYQIPTRTHLHEHYITDVEGETFFIPTEAAVLLDYEIPVEYVNKHRYEYNKKSDGIRDYIKAAKEYLNIEVRHQADFAGWYKRKKPKEPKTIVGKDGTKDINESPGTTNTP